MYEGYTPEYYKCPTCGKRIMKHVVKEGARYHVHSYSNLGTRCSEPDCEDNHHCQEKQG